MSHNNRWAPEDNTSCGAHCRLGGISRLGDSSGPSLARLHERRPAMLA